MREKEEILNVLSLHIREILRQAELDFEELQEIRLRTGRPLSLRYQGKELFLMEGGIKTKKWQEAWSVTEKELRETMEYVGKYSLYAYEDELRQGYLTLRGGHRVGVAGKTVLEGGKVKGIRHISCVNIRLSHQKKGCADEVLPYIYKGDEVCHTLIISPPCCGKTTLLRDLIRQISDGSKERRGRTVGVVDERSEIGGCYLGFREMT